MRSSRAALATAAFTLFSLIAIHAGAAPTAAQKAEARELSREAKEAYKERRYADAAEAYRRVLKLYPSVDFKLDLARALVGAGKLLEATVVLSEIQEKPAKSPAARRNQATAARLQNQLEPRIPSVRVVVTGPKARDVRALIDDQEVSTKGEVPLDPGKHVVAAEAPGFQRAEQELNLAQGAREKVELALTRGGAPDKKPESQDKKTDDEDKKAGTQEKKTDDQEKKADVQDKKPDAAQADKKPDAAQADKKSQGGSKVPAIVAFGVGGVGVGMGAVFGLLSISETNEAKKSCQDNVCRDPDALATRNAALRNGNISTVSFIAGGVGIAAGIALWIIAPGGSSAPSTGSAGHALVEPWIGLGQAGLTGVF
jgi:tetratricopeptide (TPR) repeat protein